MLWGKFSFRRPGGGGQPPAGADLRSVRSGRAHGAPCAGRGADGQFHPDSHAAAGGPAGGSPGLPGPALFFGGPGGPWRRPRPDDGAAYRQSSAAGRGAAARRGGIRRPGAAGGGPAAARRYQRGFAAHFPHRRRPYGGDQYSGLPGGSLRAPDSALAVSVSPGRAEI